MSCTLRSNSSSGTRTNNWLKSQSQLDVCREQAYPSLGEQEFESQVQVLVKKLWSIWWAFVLHTIMFVVVWGGMLSHETTHTITVHHHTTVSATAPASHSNHVGGWVLEEAEEIEEVERAGETSEGTSSLSQDPFDGPEVLGLAPEVQGQRGRAPPQASSNSASITSAHIVAHPSRGPPPSLWA